MSVRSNTSSAIYALSVALIILSGAIFYATSGSFQRFDRAEKLMDRVPGMIERFEDANASLKTTIENAEQSVAKMRAELPAVAAETGEAGAIAVGTAVRRFLRDNAKPEAER